MGKYLVERIYREYNESRPRRALGEKPPNKFAKEIAACRDFLGSPTAENSLSRSARKSRADQFWCKQRNTWVSIAAPSGKRCARSSNARTVAWPWSPARESWPCCFGTC